MKIKNFPAYFYYQLQLQRNPYLRQACLTKLSDQDVSAYMLGKEINPATRDFIKSAKQEVLIQFFKYLSDSDASNDICEALIYLNDHNPQGIDVKLLFDNLTGLAHHFYKKKQDNFKTLQYEDGVYHLNYKNKVYDLPNLRIQLKTHDHFLGNVYHTKQIIVDRKKLMLRSGDVNPDTNYKENQDGRREMAHIINNEAIAKEAAHSFITRFHARGTVIDQFHFYPSQDKNKNIPFLLLEKQASLSPLKQMNYTSAFQQAIIAAIDASETSIQIATPNLNDLGIIAALVRAAKRGVHIDIVTGKYHNQRAEKLPGMGGTNRENIQKMYEELPITDWDNIRVRWARDAENNIIMDRALTTMHCKLAIIDNEVVLSGSSPLDNNSTYRSAESDFITQSRVIAKMDQDKIFKPLFMAGEDLHDSKLSIAKESIINRLNIKLLYDEKYSDSKDELTEGQLNFKTAVEDLLTKIELCYSFSALEEILREAKSIDPNNPLTWRDSSNHPCHLFHHRHKNPKVIAELNKIYDVIVNHQAYFSSDNSRQALTAN